MKNFKPNDIETYKRTYPCFECLCDPICQNKPLGKNYSQCGMFQLWFDLLDAYAFRSFIMSEGTRTFSSKREFQDKFFGDKT